MLMPKKSKFRKSHKGKRGGKASRKLNVSYGEFGLRALAAHWVSARQIEAARRSLSKYTKKFGRVFIRIFPDKPVTQKGGEIPMGKGKGAVDHYVAVVKPGMIMFEIEGIPEKDAMEAMKAAAYKLPIKCEFAKKS